MGYPVPNTPIASGYQRDLFANNNNQNTNNPTLADKTVAINEDMQITSRLASCNNNYSSLIQSYPTFTDEILIIKQLAKAPPLKDISDRIAVSNNKYQ
jgi:hypothetical protein